MTLFPASAKTFAMAVPHDPAENTATRAIRHTPDLLQGSASTLLVTARRFSKRRLASVTMGSSQAAVVAPAAVDLDRSS
ncbi:hypothetical protein ACFRDV_38820 [Streptomyces fagopyri]|uniref:hypothetical protein n=1 Tax=Streptomyces fagopyri TaxID=2662397 RepID=UPI00368C9EFB